MKARPLAVAGGTPLFSEGVHVGRPNIGDRALFTRLLDGALDRKWLTNNGQLVQELERRICQQVGVKHCITVVNATVGLELAAKALGLKGEVIMPAYSFVATAHAMRWVGLEPVFCEVDERTHCIDPLDAERRIGPRTSAILGVHLWGQVCDHDVLAKVAARNNVILFYDAAHAFACGASDKKVGTMGACEVFSFHSTKFFNTFEGGAITTNDDGLAKRLRLMRNFGFTGFDRVEDIGTNAKLNEACAAMGLANLESLPLFIEHNRRNHEAYRQHLARTEHVRILPLAPGNSSNWQYVVAEVADSSPLSRDDIVEILWAENVLARKYFWPGIHRMAPYAQETAPDARGLSLTDAIARRVVVLPTGTNVSDQDVSDICGVIAAAILDSASSRGVLEQRRSQGAWLS